MNGKPCASPGAMQGWESIDWKTARAYVKKLQMRIVKAQKEGRHAKVKSLQWLLTHSFYAKALAIKQVTENRGKNTAGVDHEIWREPQAKFNAISKLYRRGYSPQPLRRVYILKKNGKKRPLSIPTMRDRAMQTLYKFSLEPLAETTADPNSYGFRVGRSTHDAIEQCFNVLSNSNYAQWVLEGDIKGCFDHISHDWLISNIPMDKMILEKWLNCGFVETKKLFPTSEGAPQGGSISPTLMNMTLDGLENLLKRTFRGRRIDGKYFSDKVNFIRYADDFIITARTPEILKNEVLPLVRKFLCERGLELSEEKTLITHIDDGFDFLGQNIRKYKGKLLIKPSKESVKSFLKKVRGIIKSNKTMNQENLIHRLNPVIRGWVNYHRFVVSSDTFGKIDHEIWKCLWRWALRRHPKKSKRWVKSKYFHHIDNRIWTFSTYTSPNRNGERKLVRLEYATDTKIIRYIKVIAKANPFDYEWSEYFEEREGEKMLHSFKGRDKLIAIWRNQNRCCPVCGDAINSETGFKIHTPSGEGAAKLMVHTQCHRQLHRLDSLFEPVLLTENLRKA